MNRIRESFNPFPRRVRNEIRNRCEEILHNVTSIEKRRVGDFQGSHN